MKEVSRECAAVITFSGMLSYWRLLLLLQFPSGCVLTICHNYACYVMREAVCEVASTATVAVIITGTGDTVTVT